MTRKKRIPFQIKLLEDNHIKMKSEADRLWITMSSFVSMLITKYDSTDINFTKDVK